MQGDQDAISCLRHTGSSGFGKSFKTGKEIDVEKLQRQARAELEQEEAAEAWRRRDKKLKKEDKARNRSPKDDELPKEPPSSTQRKRKNVVLSDDEG